MIIKTLEVGGPGYKTGFDAKGKQWQAMNFKNYPFPEYVRVFLPPFVKPGMIITVAGSVKQEQNGEYTNYTIQNPAIELVYRNENNQAQQLRQSDPFSGSQPMEINSDDLPF